MEQSTQSSSAPLSASTPAVNAASNVPDLMRIGSLPVNVQMDVETDILEPVVFSETFARFRLSNKGILHSNSKLTFSVDGTVDGDNGNSFFPLNIGVHSLIERCVLKAGTKTICETSDFASFMAFRSTFINPQHNKERELFTTARAMCRKWEYLDNSGADRQAPVGDSSSQSAEKYTLDTGVELLDNEQLIGERSTNLPEQTLMDSFASASGTKTSPVYQVAINDLFPFLQMNQLPLYMINDELDIELHFAKENRRCCVEVDAAGGDPGAFSFKLNRDDCKMIADYIYYPQEMMEAYQNANSNMNFTYVDYRLVKRTVEAPVGDGVPGPLILNCGGAGRIVNKLFFGLEPPPAPDNKLTGPQVSLFNSHTAQGIEPTDVAVDSGIVSHNIRYNDAFLYPIDIKNQARLFTNIQQAEGSVPFISKPEYSGEQDLISVSKVKGQVLKGALERKQFWTEDRLNRNERINSRGLELYQTWGKLPLVSALATPYTLRCWLEIVRMASLVDGVLTPTFA